MFSLSSGFTLRQGLVMYPPLVPGGCRNPAGTLGSELLSGGWTTVLGDGFMLVLRLSAGVGPCPRHPHVASLAAGQLAPLLPLPLQHPGRLPAWQLPRPWLPKHVALRQGVADYLPGRCEGIFWFLDEPLLH